MHRERAHIQLQLSPLIVQSTLLINDFCIFIKFYLSAERDGAPCRLGKARDLEARSAGLECRTRAARGALVGCRLRGCSVDGGRRVARGEPPRAAGPVGLEQQRVHRPLRIHTPTGNRR